MVTYKEILATIERGWCLYASGKNGEVIKVYPLCVFDDIVVTSQSGSVYCVSELHLSALGAHLEHVARLKEEARKTYEKLVAEEYSMRKEVLTERSIMRKLLGLQCLD